MILPAKIFLLICWLMHWKSSIIVDLISFISGTESFIFQLPLKSFIGGLRLIIVLNYYYRYTLANICV